MRRLGAFIIASILLHFLLGTGLEGISDYAGLSQKKTKDQPIDVTLLSGQASRKQKEMGRVVLDAVVPKDLQIESQEEASLLSQRRQRVKKQTVAHDYGMTQNSPVQTDHAGKPGSPVNAKSDLQSSENSKTSKDRSVRNKLTKDFKAAGAVKKSAGLILQTDPFSDLEAPQQKQGEQGHDDRTASKSNQNNDQLNQRLQALNMGDGGRSLINEKIPGVQSANITALNTNPYLYYSFYNRLVSQVRFHWENNLTGVIPSLGVMAAQRFPNREEWLTQISLYMDKVGRVIKVDVDKSSGLTDLDYAVVRAMHAGGPYRNPPTEMEENGEIRVQLNFSLFWRPSVIVNRRDTQRGAEY
jgi:hypothetical protein